MLGAPEDLVRAGGEVDVPWFKSEMRYEASHFSFFQLAKVIDCSTPSTSYTEAPRFGG